MIRVFKTPNFFARSDWPEEFRSRKHESRCAEKECIVMAPENPYGNSCGRVLTSAIAYGCGASGLRGRFMYASIDGSGSLRRGFNAIRIVPCREARCRNTLLEQAHAKRVIDIHTWERINRLLGA